MGLLRQACSQLLKLLLSAILRFLLIVEVFVAGCPFTRLISGLGNFLKFIGLSNSGNLAFQL